MSLDPAPHWALGVADVERLIDLGRPGEALVALTSMLSADPGAAELHLLASSAHAQLGDTGRAWVHARGAVALAPDEPACHRVAAVAAHWHRQRRLAAAHARTAVRLGPQQPPSHQVAAMVLCRSWNPLNRVAAIRAGRAAVRLAPVSPASHLPLGCALHRLRPGAARASYRRSLSLDPTNVSSLNNLAALEARRAPVMSINHLTEVLAIDPHHAAARHNLQRSAFWLLRLLWLAPLALSWLIRTVDPDATGLALLVVPVGWTAAAVWYRRRMPAGVRGQTGAVVLPTLSRFRRTGWAFGLFVVLLFVVLVWMGQQTRP